MNPILVKIFITGFNTQWFNTYWFQIQIQYYLVLKNSKISPIFVNRNGEYRERGDNGIGATTALLIAR